MRATHAKCCHASNWPWSRGPGDDEFPAHAQVLFQESAPNYLVTDGLAIVGSFLTVPILKAAIPERIRRPSAHGHAAKCRNVTTFRILAGL